MGVDLYEAWLRIDSFMESIQMELRHSAEESRKQVEESRKQAEESRKRAEEWRKAYEESKARNLERMLLKMKENRRKQEPEALKEQFLPRRMKIENKTDEEEIAIEKSVRKHRRLRLKRVKNQQEKSSSEKRRQRKGKRRHPITRPKKKIQEIINTYKKASSHQPEIKVWKKWRENHWRDPKKSRKLPQPSRGKEKVNLRCRSVWPENKRRCAQWSLLKRRRRARWRPEKKRRRMQGKKASVALEKEKESSTEILKKRSRFFRDEKKR